MAKHCSIPVASYIAAFSLAVGLMPQPVFGQLPWMNTGLSPEERAELLIAAMTLDQKIQQMQTSRVRTRNWPAADSSLSDATSKASPSSPFRRCGLSTAAPG